jgi:hypothetical protein
MQTAASAMVSTLASSIKTGKILARESNTDESPPTVIQKDPPKQQRPHNKSQANKTPNQYDENDVGRLHIGHP